MENPTQASDLQTLFEMLNNANNANSAKPTLTATAIDVATNTLSLVSGSVKLLADGLELTNGFVSEQLDIQVASRTKTKVKSTMSQLTDIGELVAFGANPEWAVKLATSYRR